MKDLIITHSKDVDGVSPIILLKLCQRDVDYYLLDNDEVEEKIPVILGKDLSEYDHIYITDLSVPDSVYQEVLKKDWVSKFKVFDHHKTHQYASKYPFVTLQLEECATSLFYQYVKTLYPVLNQEKIKKYVDCVLDLDMWYWVAKKNLIAKQLGDLFTIFGNLSYIEYFKEKLTKEKDFKLNDFEEKILKIEEEKIKNYFQLKEEQLKTYTYKNYQVGVVFAEQYKSELGMMLQNAHRELDFIAMINPSGGVSLRTQKDAIDLSDLASVLGGGGHPKASGFPVPEEARESFVKQLFKTIEKNE